MEGATPSPWRPVSPRVRRRSREQGWELGQGRHLGRGCETCRTGNGRVHLQYYYQCREYAAIKVVGHCDIKQGPNQVYKGTLLCGASAPHMHHCLIVTMNQEALPCPVGAPRGGCGQNRIEFPLLYIPLSLPEGPGTAEPVTCPESPVAKVASIGVQLERRRRCPGNVEEAALAIPV